MELKEIKKEVEALSSIEQNLKEFQENWYKPLRRESENLSFLKKLDATVKKELDQKLLGLSPLFYRIEGSKELNEKLRSYAHHLIELKLTTFNNNTQRSEMITNILLNDKILNVPEIMAEVKKLSVQIKELEQKYHQINEFLEQNLSLENQLVFMDLPHKKPLQNLVQTAEKQSELVKKLGKYFVSLVKEIRGIKTC